MTNRGDLELYNNNYYSCVTFLHPLLAGAVQVKRIMYNLTMLTNE